MVVVDTGCLLLLLLFCYSSHPPPLSITRTPYLLFSGTVPPIPIQARSQPPRRDNDDADKNPINNHKIHIYE